MKSSEANHLMKRFIDGEEDSFIELYHSFKRPIFHYLLKLLSSEALAEEITHDTFLKVYTKKDQFNAGFSFTTWAWTIARNTAFDHLRRKDPLQYKDILRSEEIEQTVDQTQGSEDLLNQKIEREILLQAVEELPEHQKEVMYLRLYSELELQEIAEVTQKNISSIKSTFYRAQRTILEKCENTLEEVV